MWSVKFIVSGGTEYWNSSKFSQAQYSVVFLLPKDYSYVTNNPIIIWTTKCFINFYRRNIILCFKIWVLILLFFSFLIGLWFHKLYTKSILWHVPHSAMYLNLYVQAHRPHCTLHLMANWWMVFTYYCNIS